MSALFDRRTKRATAWVVLLVWLFALSAGVANACLLQEHDAHGHARAIAGGDDVRPPPQARGTDHVIPSDANAEPADSHASNPSCLKVCDDATRSPVKQAASPDFSDVVLLALPVAAWPAPTVPGAADAHAFGATQLPPPPDPPPRVRFSRLAL